MPQVISPATISAYLCDRLTAEQRAEFERAMREIPGLTEEVVSIREFIQFAVGHWARKYVIRAFASEPIRAFLDGTMTPLQLETFELAMIDDPQLASLVDAERLLRIGLRAQAASPAPAEKDA